MNGYTYVQGKNNYIRYDINDGQALYGTEARKKNGKIVTLSDENIAEFGRRMNGRTMLEEMMLAGYKESDLKFEVQEKKPFYGVYPNGIHGTSGIAFKFENVQCDKSKVELLWNKEQYMFGKYLQKIAPATWLYGDDERSISQKAWDAPFIYRE